MNNDYKPDHINEINSKYKNNNPGYIEALIVDHYYNRKRDIQTPKKEDSPQKIIRQKTDI